MNTAIIFAGGVGRRMKSTGLPKQFLKVNSIPIIVHTLQIFQDCKEIDQIIISCVENYIEYVEELISLYHITKVAQVVPGGKTAQESIYYGLKMAEKLGSLDDIVLIHDGVRPLIDEKLILKNIDTVKKYGSAISAVRSKETVVVVDESNIEATDRNKTYLARAPQSFVLRDILLCHELARQEGKEFVDCCTMMIHYSKKVYFIETSYQNIKITTPDDFYIFKALLSANENAQVLGVE